MPILNLKTISAAVLAAAISGPASAVDPVDIRIASDTPAAPHPAGMAQEEFARRVMEEIPGSKARVYTGASLYKIAEAVEAMTEGNLEIAWGQYGKTAPIDPYTSILVGPMLLTSTGAVDQLDTFETTKMLHQRFNDVHDITVFGSAHLSFYMGAGASESRLITPDDFAGKKMRSMGPAENAMLSAFGSNPTTMSFGDVPPALETGVIDGLLTSLGGFNRVKEQAPYFTVAGINGIVGDYYWVGASNKWWSSLDDEQRTIIEGIMVDEIIPLAKALNFCNDKLLIDKYGTEDPAKPGIYIMKPDEASALASKLGSATSDWIKENTPGPADAWVDKFAEEAKAAVAANPVGESDLDKTDCAAYQQYFDKYANK